MTTLDTIKHNLIDKIITTNDEKLLNAINTIFQPNDEELILHLNSYQIEMLQRSEIDISENRIISEEEVKKLDANE